MYKHLDLAPLVKPFTLCVTFISLACDSSGLVTGSPQSTGIFLPLCCVDGGGEVWTTARGWDTGFRCSRSEAGGGAWWGDWWREGPAWPEERRSAGANSWLQRKREPSGWSATLRPLLKEKRRTEEEPINEKLM